VIAGTLTDNHTAEASAMNIIWAWDDIAGTIMDMPFAMANGCVMSGTIDANSINLTVSGESKDTYRKFTYSVSATLQ
jgi:hypothetical protein